MVAVKDPAVERYNRRTRAIERLAAAHADQAGSLDRIAAAIEVQALAAATTVGPVHTTDGVRSWTQARAKVLLGRLTTAVDRIAR